VFFSFSHSAVLVVPGSGELTFPRPFWEAWYPVDVRCPVPFLAFFLTFPSTRLPLRVFALFCFPIENAFFFPPPFSNRGNLGLLVSRVYRLTVLDSKKGSSSSVVGFGYFPPTLPFFPLFLIFIATPGLCPSHARHRVLPVSFCSFPLRLFPPSVFLPCLLKSRSSVRSPSSQVQMTI